MPNLILNPTQKEIDNFITNKSYVSQSRLKHYLKSTSPLAHKKNVGMSVGSILDMMITTQNNYFATEVTFYNELLVKIVDVLLIDNTATPAQVFEIAQKDTWTFESTRENEFSYATVLRRKNVQKIIEEHMEFYALLLLNPDTKWVSEKDYDVAKKAHNRYIEIANMHFPEIFTANFQSICYGDFHGTPVKGMADITYVVDDTLHVVDIKFTSAETLQNFAYDIKKYGYRIQAAIYQHLFKECTETYIHYPDVKVVKSWIIGVTPTSCWKIPLSNRAIEIGTTQATEAVRRRLTLPLGEYDWDSYTQEFDSKILKTLEYD